MPFPPCPECRTPLDPARVLDVDVTTERVAAGTDAEADFPLCTLSCGGCLAAHRLVDYMGWSIRETVARGADTARLRDRLRDAAGREALAGEVRAVLSSRQALLLGTPEIAADVAGALGKRHVLARAARGEKRRVASWVTEPLAFDAPWWLTERGGIEGPLFAAGTPLTLVGFHGGCLLCMTAEGERVAVPLALTTPA